MVFKENQLDLGIVKLGQKVKGSFKYEGEANIVSMNSGCGCTTPQHDEKNKEITVEFVKNAIPSHLAHTNSYTPTIPITVVEEKDELKTTHVLFITAKVTK